MARSPFTSLRKGNARFDAPQLPWPDAPEGSTWQLGRIANTLAIPIDGREVGKGAVPVLDKTVRLGMTRIDPEHDGTLLIRSVRFGGAR